MVGEVAGHASMAADGLALISRRYWAYNSTTIANGIYDRQAERVLAHELAHMGWGLGVGVDHDRDNWLSEGFAQYMAITYMDDRYGREGVTDTDPNWFVRWLWGMERDASFSPRTVEGSLVPAYHTLIRDDVDEALRQPFRDREHAERGWTLTYAKSFLVARALELYMPRHKVDETIRTIFTRFGGKIATSADVRAVAEEVSGRDLSALFEGWVDGTRSVDYAVVGIEPVPSTKRNRRTTLIRVSRTGDGVLPVQVVIIDEGGARQTVVWNDDRVEGALRVNTSLPIRSVAIDPLGLAPDPDRANNFYPRDFDANLFASQSNSEAYSFTVTPTRRLADTDYYGPAVGGNYLNDHRWWFGVGLDNVNQRQPVFSSRYGPVEFRDTEVLEVNTYAEIDLNIDRNSEVFVRGRIVGTNEPEDEDDLFVRAAYVHSFYSAPNLGTTGKIELPMTRVVAILDRGFITPPFSDVTVNLLAGTLMLVRDDRRTLGMTHELALSMGSYWFEAVEQNYQSVRWDGSQAFSLGLIGYLDLAASLGALNDGNLFPGLMFTPDLHPTTRPTRGARLAQVALAYRLPLVQRARVKNLLTLHTFVFDALDISAYYHAHHITEGIATEIVGQGVMEVDTGPYGWGGDAGVALDAGFELFDETRLTLKLGAVTPVWPTEQSFTEFSPYFHLLFAFLHLDETEFL